MTVLPMDIRPERIDDQQDVRRLYLAAFGAEGQLVADLVDGLRELVTADQGLSLVAEDGGEVVGHVMFTRSLLDAPRRLVDVQVLSPVAVLPERQGRGDRLGADPPGPADHDRAVSPSRVPRRIAGVLLPLRVHGRGGAGLSQAVAAHPRRCVSGDPAARIAAVDDGNAGLLRDLLAA